MGYLSGQPKFNGTIDEVRIWNRALSPEEINASYNSKINKLFRNFTDQLDGEYEYYAYSINLEGNSNQTETRTLTIDTLKPSITIILPENGTVTNDNTPLLKAASSETADMWYQVDGYNEEWSMFQHDCKHTGVTNSSAPLLDNMHVLWTFDMNCGALRGSYSGSPVVSGGIVYAGTRCGTLYAVNESTGEKIWEFIGGDSASIESSPAVSEGVIYFGTRK